MAAATIPLPVSLREGDRLSAGEFLCRWDAMPDLKHAELVDGIVFMASPVSRSHGKLQVSFGGWLLLYAENTPGCEVMSDTTWIMGEKDVPQPDLALRVTPESGGQSHDAGAYCGGAPELAVEISGSSSSRDLGIKLELYCRAGVREYITVLLEPQRILWRELVNGTYQEIQPDAEGFLRSRVFPGLWLDPEAVWDAGKSLRPALELGLKNRTTLLAK